MSPPPVSVGIPVFNGGRFLGEAIRSVLDQTFADIEVIIADNASTDETPDICESFCRDDSRVRYVRHSRNIGLAKNWNSLVSLANGRYFKWASANDYLARDNLAECLRVFAEFPDSVLCYGATQLVTEDEVRIGAEIVGASFTDDCPSARFLRVCAELSLNNAQSGLFRLAELKGTALDRDYPHGDFALISEIALYGKIRAVSDVLLYRRSSPATTASRLSPLELTKLYHPNATAPMKLTLTRYFLDCAGCLSRAPIGVVEQLKGFLGLMKLARWKRKELMHEVLSAVS